MPLYELLCLAQPALAKPALMKMISRVAGVLYSKGAVVTDLKSYGDQYLAYKIKGTRGKYDQAHIWQLDFAVAPEVLKDVNHELRVNEQVLRWVVVKRAQQPPLETVRQMVRAKEALDAAAVHYDLAAAAPAAREAAAASAPMQP